MTTAHPAGPAPSAGPPPTSGQAEPGGQLPRQRSATPAAPRRSYRRLHLTAVGAAVAAVGLSLALPAGASAHAVTGSVVVWGEPPAGLRPGDACTGGGAEADLTAGASVRIKDATGEPLATGTLQPGRWDGAACVFTFLVPDVARAGAYRIGVGDTARPSAPFTYRDMRAHSWSVRLSYGV